MSRIEKYKYSIDNKINDFLQNNKSFLFEQIKYALSSGSRICPIMILTIINALNKHDDVIYAGYYIALSIEFLHTAIVILKNMNSNKKYNNKENKEEQSFHEKYGNTTAIMVVITLSSYVLICLNECIDNLKKCEDNKICNNICSMIVSIMSDKLTKMGLFGGKLFNILNEQINNKNNNVVNLKQITIENNNELIKQLSKMVSIDENELEQLNSKISNFFEMIIMIAWVVGDYKAILNPDVDKVVKKMAQSFSIMYKISDDFQDVEEDSLSYVKNNGSNHVLNFGLDNSFEIFMQSKQNFIKYAIELNICTKTIQEILDKINDRIDRTLDEKSIVSIGSISL